MVTKNECVIAPSGWNEHPGNSQYTYPDTCLTTWIPVQLPGYLVMCW